MDYICGTCKHYEDCFNTSGGIDIISEDDTCEDWEEDKDELTEDEKRINAGDIEAHRIMVERREIE